MTEDKRKIRLMKRSDFLLLSGVAMLSLAGCSREKGSGKTTEINEARDPVETPSSSADTQSDTITYDGLFPAHDPYGRGIGACPGRVVWTHSAESVSWDGNGYWWNPENFDLSVVQAMVNQAIAQLAAAKSADVGWQTLFEAHNKSRGKEPVGYTSGEHIAIKANINGSAVNNDDTSTETNLGYTNPVLLKALLMSLVEEAGVLPECITVYDVSRKFPDYLVALCAEGVLQGVRFAERGTANADAAAAIRWSYDFQGATNHLPTCVTQADYLINLANLKGHSYGITLCGKNHFGSFINNNALRPPEGAGLHQFLTSSDMGVYSPLVDFMANQHVGRKTMLYMLDAFICAPSEGTSITRDNSIWQQAPFNDDFTASVLVSQDPVAIDSVGADLLTNEPTIRERNSLLDGKVAVENYLHEASMIESPPSGITYQDGSGETPTNLGVHEHWNNATEKLYSRNLGKDEGIELVYLAI